MANIYQPPEANLYENNDDAITDYELYKISGIVIATFFGTVFAGGILLSKNYRNLGKLEAARKALIYSGVATLLVLVISIFLPDSVPSITISLPQLIAMAHIAKQQQSEDIDQHTKKGGKTASNWKAFGISLLVLLGILAIILPIAFMIV